MTLKTKIYWSIGILIGLVFIVMLAGGIAFYRLEQDAANRMTANLLSLRYTHTMQNAVERLIQNPENREVLRHLRITSKQESENITEPGEQTAVYRLEQLLSDYQKQPNVALLPRIAHEVQYIEDLNLDALEAKEVQAQETATWYGRMLITLAGCVILSLVFFFSYFPPAVLAPIRQISESMEAIARGDYHHRMDAHRKDELGQMAHTFNQMAQELEVYRQSSFAELMQEKMRLHEVLKTMPDGLVLLDHKQQLLAFNPVAALALGLPPLQQLATADASELAAKNDLFRELWSLKKAPQQPLEVLQANGKTRYFIPEKHYLNLQQDNPEQQYLGTLLVLHNVTEVHQAHQAKSNFLATVSHELNTPIATFQLSLQLLRDHRIGSLNGEQQELIERLQQESSRMQQLVHSLLDMSRLEAVGVQLKPQTIEAQTLVREAVTTLHTQAAQRQINMLLPPDHPPHLIQADPEKTLWILINLLGNALRYSPDGGSIQLGFSTEGAHLRFSVTDQGPGIPEDIRQRLFDRFATFSIAGRGKSYGLGLAIAHEFVLAQGGNMGVTTGPNGVGACFWFTLPTTQV